MRDKCVYLCSYVAAGCSAPPPRYPPSPLGASDEARRASLGQSHLEAQTVFILKTTFFIELPAPQYPNCSIIKKHNYMGTFRQPACHHDPLIQIVLQISDGNS